MGERGSCQDWRWFGKSLSLPVESILPLAYLAIGIALLQLNFRVAKMVKSFGLPYKVNHNPKRKSITTRT